MRKIYKKLLSITLIFLIAINFGSQSFATTSYRNPKLTELFYKASPNEIVLYYNGFPIEKKYIDERTATIKQEKLKEIELNAKSLRSFSLMNNGSSRIPSKYKDAVIEKKIISQNYSQTDTHTYLSNKTAVEFAKKYNFDAKGSVAWFLASAVPKVGIAISAMGMLLAIKDGLTSNSLRNLTDRGKSVLIKTASSRYGSFTVVKEWNGVNIDLSEYSSSITKIRITKISYR